MHWGAQRYIVISFSLSILCIRISAGIDVRQLKPSRIMVNYMDSEHSILKSISIINKSNYIVRSTSGNNTYTVTATKSGWACSCPDYASRNAKCKHVYAVEFRYIHQDISIKKQKR